jgi:hypothetical protein
MPPPLPTYGSLHGSMANLNLGAMDRLAEDEDDDQWDPQEDFVPSAQTQRRSAALQICWYKQGRGQRDRF